jgi:hypothetical protein
VPGWARAADPPPGPYGPFAGSPPEDEIAVLRQEAEWLQQRLEEIGQRIETLEGDA